MKKTFWKNVWSVFLSAVLAGELAVILDTISVLNSRALSVAKFGALFAVLFALVHFVPFVREKLRCGGVIVLTSAAVLLAGCVFCWKCVSEDAVYTAVDDGKEALYSGQSVLLLVPHQDDDINVLGGVIEEYRKYGSQVTVVFSTNGDYEGLQEIRFQEALDALEAMGVPGENVIFLGYGDQWEGSGPHLYNAEPGQVMTSVYGSRETYGTAAKGVWREGAEYTIDNFLKDIEDVILSYRPDVIYCVDYDYNIDHRALSHSFEKVMGKILKDDNTYRPLIFKGYAYNSAWESAWDFYGDNLLSTHNVFELGYNELPGIYRWEERVRLPVHGEGLSRSVISARAHKILAMYASQGANMCSPRVINSDKVFWQRHTESLTHQAKITVTSGNGTLLNDFMLLECDDLVSAKDPHDGAWIPESGDGEKQVTITFENPEDIHTVVLYDHPGENSNVLNARLAFSDGTSMETGALDPAGAASRFPVEKSGITSLTVTILEGEGTAGLTEIEVFSGELPEAMTFVKIMDEGENFVYDYWIDPSGSQTFRLYTGGLTDAEFTVSCDSVRCSALLQGENLEISCPAGESCTVTVVSSDGLVSDSVYIQNPGRLARFWTRLWLWCEETVMQLCEERRIHERIFVWRMTEKIPEALERLVN